MTSLAVSANTSISLELQRFCVKFFARPPAEIDDAKFIDIFHEWIRRQALSGILIDVADYLHLYNGPGVMLISHEANLSMDRAENRLGLMYQRKTSQPATLAHRILAAIEVTLTACRLLEQEPLLNGDLKFSGDEFVFVANDRLLAPNNDATYKALHDELETVAQCLYANADIESQHRSEDPRERFSVFIKSSTPTIDIESLLANVRRRPH